MEEKDRPIIFNEWLKRRRSALDMTQNELAVRVGCSVGTLRKIESGERRPSKQLAGLLAKALEIPNGEQQTFIRVSRGELNLERLGKPSPGPLPPLSDLSALRQIHPTASLETGASPATNRIPFEVIPIIGRDSELAALGRLFNDPQCRLLTLTGVGGIGKTRLAIEFAACNLMAFPGGVFYVPLTSVDSPEKIVPAIADVIDCVFFGPTEPKDQLINYISSHIKQKALFVFDNLEHLLVRVLAQDDRTGLVELIAEILQRLPNVHILGTSRERLNLHGEWTYELHGLSVPPAHFVERFEDYNALVLFVNSAQRIRADFQVTDNELSAVIQICQLVEGVPLAIELAAAWVGILTCQEIAQEIKTNIDFLSTSMRGIPTRHRSIRATFEHSWNLLTDEERMALCQLSVFHGGFDRDAAFQVAGASLPLLASLSAKSLVRRTESGCYDLHEVIRQCALSHLHDYPDNLGTYRRHCEYYLTFVQERENSLKCASQQEAMRQLIDEIDNIHTAWAWAINHERFTLLGQAGRAYGWYFELAGLYSEGIEQFEPLSWILKARWHEKEWHRVLGLTYVQQALLYFRKGDNDKARRLYEESITVLRPTGDKALLAEALIFLGIILHLFGEYIRAKSVLEEGLALAREDHEEWFEAYAIYNLGYIASLMGRYSEGYDQMMTGIVIWRKLGDPHYIALGLNFIVTTLLKLGKFEEGKAFILESIALCEQVKNRWGMGTAYRYLGSVYAAEGHYAEAQIYLLKSLEVFGEYFTGWHIAISKTHLGHATRMAGSYTEARKYYLDALRLSVEEKAIPIVLDALSGLAYLQEKNGKAENALLLCYCIINHPSSEEETRSRADQLRVVLESRLRPAQIKTAHMNAKEKAFDLVVKGMLETA